MKFDDALVNALKDAKSIVVVTGSGVSAESGVPTFRGENGLWRQFRAEELATPGAFNSNPALVWEWYDWRRGIIGRAQPNPAHMTIAQMEGRYQSFLLITQNVDGLHRKAGSRKLVEIHGNIWRVRCTEEEKTFFLEENPLKVIPPRCDCGALLRPDVVWFGEQLPIDGLDNSIAHIQGCDLLMSIGTSGLVHPVASFPRMAKAGGAVVVEINVDETPNTVNADFSLKGKAGEILPALFASLTVNQNSTSQTCASPIFESNLRSKCQK